jgi:hypothetical protein
MPCQYISPRPISRLHSTIEERSAVWTMACSTYLGHLIGVCAVLGYKHTCDRGLAGKLGGSEHCSPHVLMHANSYTGVAFYLI